MIDGPPAFDRTKPNMFIANRQIRFGNPAHPLIWTGANLALALKNHVHARCKFSTSTPACWVELRTADPHQNLRLPVE